jgi:MFS family permease
MNLNPNQIFYGWVIVFALASVGGFTSLMAGSNFPLFVSPMIKDLGFNQAAFGWAHTGRMVATASGSPLIGRMIDRYGARQSLALAGALVSAAVISLAFVNEAWQLIGLFILIGLVGLIPGSNLYTAVPIAKWFVVKRGRAMSLAYIGTPIGIIVVVPFTQWLLQHMDWRATWVAVGLAGGIFTVLIAITLMRRKPEDMGLRPDGVASSGMVEALSSNLNDSWFADDEYSWQRSDAIRSAAFWRLSVAFGLAMLGATSLQVYRFPHFVEQGISPQIAAFGYSVDAGMSVITAVVLGFMLDKVPTRVVGAIGFLLMAGAILLTMATTDAYQMFMAAILYGTGISGIMVLQNTMWPAYFGRNHIGSIRGLAFPISLSFGAVGAPMTGLVRDATGSYFPAWWVAFAAMLLAAALLVTTRRPAMRSEVQSIDYVR